MSVRCTFPRCENPGELVRYFGVLQRRCVKHRPILYQGHGRRHGDPYEGVIQETNDLSDRAEEKGYKP